MIGRYLSSMSDKIIKILSIFDHFALRVALRIYKLRAFNVGVLTKVTVKSEEMKRREQQNHVYHHAMTFHGFIIIIYRLLHL